MTRFTLAFLFTILSLCGPATAAEILLQSTTSTRNSGLYDHLLPQFTAATGIDVKVVAVGTGQALANARNGDADVVIVHAKAAELEFVEQGFGVDRRDLMYNDFVLIGPAGDPAGVAGAPDVTAALSRIRDTGSVFVSRGDDSGTHKKELALWAAMDVAPDGRDPWYLEAGAGMGATINIAVQRDAYTLTDRATWAAFAGKLEHIVVFQGDAALFNQYGVILVNPDRHSHVRETEARAFADWLTSGDGQAAIAAFRIDGAQMFFPNAKLP